MVYIHDKNHLKDSLEVAKRVKEMFSYVTPDLAKEFMRFDEKPEKYFKTYEGIKVSCSLQLFSIAYRLNDYY